MTVYGTKFDDASFSQVQWKNVYLADCTFIKNNFFQSRLGGVSFADCLFFAPTVSENGGELRGVQISAQQAVDLIGIFGLKVI